MRDSWLLQHTSDLRSMGALVNSATSDPARPAAVYNRILNGTSIAAVPCRYFVLLACCIQKEGAGRNSREVSTCEVWLRCERYVTGRMWHVLP
jgi:hypothetical protein